jgi:hypothetical protein
MKKVALLCLLGSWMWIVPAFAEERDDSTYEEDYRLYDRNERNLDFNPYNFPASRNHSR